MSVITSSPVDKTSSTANSDSLAQQAAKLDLFVRQAAPTENRWTPSNDTLSIRCSASDAAPSICFSRCRAAVTWGHRW